MHFPASGVECSPWLPPAAAFVIACFTAPAGLSGAFLLLPFQMSVLGFVAPAVAPTNLLYNAIAIPGGVYRYTREGRMLWPLAWSMLGGTLPGILLGAFLRVRYLPHPHGSKLLAGLVLLYLGGRLLMNGSASNAAVGMRDRAMRTNSIGLRRVEYEFSGRVFAFRPLVVTALSTVVGVLGGASGIGGGAIIAPFLVGVLRLPVHTVAGATLLASLVSSIGGVAAFEFLARTEIGHGVPVSPDWALGGLFGIGGFFGAYAGAALQRYVRESWMRLVLGVIVSGIAVAYVIQYFR